jgi:hypothetical protein
VQVTHDDYDAPVPADYDGDGKADLASYSPVTGAWHIRSSRDGTVTTLTLKPANLDLPWPAPGDYDGVGHAQPAVMDFSGWHIAGHADTIPLAPPPTPGLSAANAAVLPTPGDYNGDRRLDLSYWEAEAGLTFRSNWRFAGSANYLALPAGPSTFGRPVAVDIKVLDDIARFTLVARDCQADPAC